MNFCQGIGCYFTLGVNNLIRPTLSRLYFQEILDELIDHLKQNKVLCKYCGSSNVVKIGHRIKNQGKVQWYRCKQCNRSFTDEVTRYGNQDVFIHDQILDLVVQGVNSESIKEIVNKRLQCDGKDESITKQTVLNIIKKDCQFLSTFENYLFHDNFSLV
mgnify:CR=1 FL=1